MVGLFLFDCGAGWGGMDGWIRGRDGGFGQLESSIDVIPSRLSNSYIPALGVLHTVEECVS